MSAVIDQTGESDIVLFDGVCHLCIGSVRFLLRYDKDARYRFAWLQSPAARRLLSGVDMAATDSVVLLMDGQVFFRSTAIIKMMSGLGGPWRLAGILLLVPVAVRDGLYNYIGSRRYRWFGRSPTCVMPSGSSEDRFLLDGMQEEASNPRSSDAGTRQM